MSLSEQIIHGLSKGDDIRKWIDSVTYGEIVIKVQDGKIVFFQPCPTIKPADWNNQR